ncbi:MAG: condensation domain-containing protein, partial [Candidatus Heimdallarchaeota archaeon]
VNFVLHLDKRIDENIMKKALRLCLDAEPILGCNFKTKARKPYWERREDLDHEDFFRLFEAIDNEEQMKNFLVKQINPSSDPIIQVRVFREINDTLVIKSDHSVMDGGGFYDFLKLFTSIYSKLEGNPIYEIVPNTHVNRELSQVLKHYRINKKLKSFIKDTTKVPRLSLPPTGRGRKLRKHKIKRFSRKRFDAIKEYGKKHNATINDVFLTAFYRALFCINDAKPGTKVTVAIPTDLRALLPDKKAETIANLVSSTFAIVEFKTEESFEETIHNISQQMKKKKEIYLGLGYMFIINNIFRVRFTILEWIIKRVYKRLMKKGQTYPILTNVGIVDSHKYHFGKANVIDGYLVSPVNWAPSFSMGLSSFNKVLTLSIGYCEDSYTSDVVTEFLDLIDLELPK